VRCLAQMYSRAFWAVLPLFVIAPAVWLGVMASREARIDFMHRLARGNRHNPWLALAAVVALISSIVSMINMSHSRIGGGPALIQLGAALLLLLALGIGYRRAGPRPN
jgi:hypothetical protein